MHNPNKNSILNRAVFKDWYFRKGLIIVDFFVIIALIQYFIFDGSFNAMLLLVKEIFK